jgi:hypothetical protein
VGSGLPLEGLNIDGIKFKLVIYCFLMLSTLLHVPVQWNARTMYRGRLSYCRHIHRWEQGVASSTRLWATVDYEPVCICSELPESLELNDFLAQKDIIVLHCSYQSVLRYW